MPATPFFYAERVPDAAVIPWVAAYWEFAVRDGAPPMHHVPPDGCTSITAIVGGSDRGAVLLSGPWLDPLAVPVGPGSRYFGARLQAGAVPAAFGVDPNVLRNQSQPADGLIGEFASALRAAIMDCPDLDAASAAFDGVFRSQLPSMRPVDPLVVRAVSAIVAARGEGTVSALVTELATSERTLLRRFRAATGLSPKQFARVRRLLAAAWQVVDGEDTWSEIAAGAGYADQPHLHHDVVGLTGLRPDDFGSRIRATEHDHQVKR